MRGKQLPELPSAPEEAPILWKEDLSGSLSNELSELPRMDHAIDSFLNYWGLHGASLAIVRNDSLLYARGYGWADASTRMHPDVRLRLASVSKLLTAVGIMRLQEEGKVFLEQNARKAGVVQNKSGLQYEVLTEGTGKHPKATDKVRCHYEGRLIDDTVFDSSYRRNEPAVFGLNQVIAGWTEGLQLMGEGAKYRFYIPYLLGYGESGAGEMIPPYATLVFDVELLEVI